MFQVIRYRNELMHSCELRVKDEWMKHFQNALTKLIQQFSNVQQMAEVGKQIEEVSMFGFRLELLYLSHTVKLDLCI